MRKVMYMALCGLVMLAVSSSAFGAEKATPAEVVAKVQQAVKLIQDEGDAAYTIIRDKKGPFVWKDTYVFVGDLDGRLLVHPNSKLEGRNMMGAKDVTGKLFHAALVNSLKNSPDGDWSEYHWVKPNEKKPSQKASFSVVVPNTTIYAGAGVWDVDAEQAKQAVY